MFKLYPYKVGSASVKKLKTALNAMIIKLEGSHYRYRSTHKVINWGNSRRPSWMSNDVPVINQPEAVAIAGNKLSTFQTLSENGVATVPFTVNTQTAQDWLQEGKKVFVRHSLTGHSGEGIEVIEPVATVNTFSQERQERIDYLSDIVSELGEIGERNLAIIVEDYISSFTPDGIAEQPELPNAPLYTAGVTNVGEYRVHVFNDNVLLYQKKSRKVDEETGEVITADGAEADVRNLASNWVYRTGNLRRLERIEELAKSAINTLGLDFGAVDIIMNQDGDVFVLEVNTAPGISNTETAEAYINAFRSL